jgi:hypothetical protein
VRRFKLGDRVRQYGSWAPKGTITSTLTPQGCVWVQWDGFSSEGPVLPKDLIPLDDDTPKPQPCRWKALLGESAV